MSEVKKCKYCGTALKFGDMCGTCREKKKTVHRLWLICQEIKKATGQKVK